MNKAARTIRHATLRTLVKNLANSYLGLHLTQGQLRAAAKTLYTIHTKRKLRPSRFHWDNNALNTPPEDTCSS